MKTCDQFIQIDRAQTLLHSLPCHKSPACSLQTGILTLEPVYKQVIDQTRFHNFYNTFPEAVRYWSMRSEPCVSST
jgi:hypothetical protein